ncbi:MAG: hypothetical protein GY765_30430 [bacterium]|nr:hypothetical protein [bacterium]
MSHKEIVKVLSDRLKEHGSEWRTISIHHLKEATEEIRERHRQGEIADELYNGYLSDFQSSASGVLPGARAIIVVATPHPPHRVGFTRNGSVHKFTIPPTYFHHTDDEVAEILKGALEPTGYEFAPARLPEKLVAVRSGLARYGRNNIAYIDGMGSYHRLRSYYTDLPGLSDFWRPAALMEGCEQCDACIASCPTGALSHDRFQVQANRCLTFFNETTIAWPQYVKSGWDLDNKCLVGCMKCQFSCPNNPNQKDRLEPVEIFSEEETQILLEVKEQARIPEQTLKKLERLYLTEYIPTMARNLGILFQAERHS